jgi:signal peptidase
MRLDTSRTRQVAHIVAVLALIALVVPFMLYAFPGAIGADRSYVVLSGSMEPAISAGDAIIVERVDPRTIAVGDVITYRTSDEGVPTTHRVIGVIDRTESGPTLAFRTQGDANEDADVGAVRPEQVIGSVVLVLPYVGHVVGFVGNEVGYVLLVLLPILLFVLNEAWTFRRSRRRAGEGDDAGTGTDAGVGPAADPSSDGGGNDGAGFTLTATDLTLSIGVLLVLAAFSGWMALRTIDVEAVIVFAASLTTLVLALALRMMLPAASGPPAEAGTPDGDGRRVVGSLAALTAAARERDRPVITDEEGSYFVDDGVLYLHREGLSVPSPTPEPTPAPDRAPVPAIRRVPVPAIRRVSMSPVADGGDTDTEAER